MKRLLRFLMPIAVAGILGPLAGGLAVCVLVAGTYLADWPLGPIADLLGACMLYMVFAYVLGWPIALLAGLLMSIWMSFRAPGIIAAVAAAANLLGPLPNLAFGTFAFTLGASVAAAILCWLVVRP